MSSTAAFQPAVRRSRGWVLFFGVLTVLTATGILLPILYNLNQQLRPDQLASAEQRWREANLTDYDLTYSVRYDRELLAERHIVLVRGRKVVWAACEGEVIHSSPTLGAMVGVGGAGTGRGGGHDISAIFAHLHELLGQKEESGGRNLLVAVFDPKGGWPRRFVYRVRKSSTREEWDLKVWEADELGSERRP
jgi:hypothetical protein